MIFRDSTLLRFHSFICFSLRKFWRFLGCEWRFAIRDSDPLGCRLFLSVFPSDSSVWRPSQIRSVPICAPCFRNFLICSDFLRFAFRTTLSFLSLFWGNSLFFFFPLRGIPFFVLSVFSFFSRYCRGSVGIKNPFFFVWFSFATFSNGKKERKDREIRTNQANPFLPTPLQATGSSWTDAAPKTCNICAFDYQKFYTPARKYYMHIFCFRINFPKNYISVT